MDLGPCSVKSAASSVICYMSFSEIQSESNEIAKYQAMLDEVVERNPPYPAGRFSGRGIVICGGGETYFTCAWVCVGMLRRMGCTLPIEFWYRGRAEMNSEMRALLEREGVACIDAYERARQDPMRRLDSWELKSFAITYSKFEEVLYIDSDNVAVQNPEFLFSCREYLQTGAVFWPDRYIGPGSAQEWLSRRAWEICRVPYRIEPEIEAGQLLIDKRRCWLPLSVTLHMNAHSDFYFAYFYGDKDTFHLAWRRAQIPFALIPHPIRNLGNSDVIVQHDFDGNVLFQHRNGDKWSVTRQPKQIRGFMHEAACLELLNDLRTRWRPPVRHLPSEFTTVEKAAYESICSTRFFEYELERNGARVLEFQPDFTIGRGAALMEVGWTIEEDKDGEAVLAIRNANGPTCFLRRTGDRSWAGRWLVYDRMRVRLSSAAERSLKSRFDL